MSGLANRGAPAYLALNPKGRVPTLVTPEGSLSENPALLAFIAQAFPDANLAPLDDPFAFARVQSFNSYLCATVHVAHAHGRRGPRWADNPDSWADMKQKVPTTMADCIGLIEREMLVGPWVMGETFTICDPYLFTICLWLEADGVDATKYPGVHAPHAAHGGAPPRSRRCSASNGPTAIRACRSSGRTLEQRSACLETLLQGRVDDQKAHVPRVCRRARFDHA